ncbi:MAG: MoxR family ATPase [Pseudomonadota bacterium]
MTPAHDTIRASLADQGYIASEDLAACVALSQSLGKPVLLEGEAGVGKTGLAQALADYQDTELIRLQCFEGLDASAALYDWNYPRQLLAARHGGNTLHDEDATSGLFSEAFLLERPLLKAIRCAEPCVLLIDEIDRADEEFEAFLLELLSDFQVSVPELGTLRARSRPHVLLTSNGTRELSDALRRRCLYFFIDYPDPALELDIVKSRLPELSASVASQAVDIVQQLRSRDLLKVPGVAETLDWCAALMGLRIESIEHDRERVRGTLVCLLKTRADREKVLDQAFDEIVTAAASPSP